MRINIALIVGALAAASTGPAVATTYTFQPITAPNLTGGASVTVVTGINNTGQVVGYTYGLQPNSSFFDRTPTQVTQGFVLNFTTGIYTIINDPAGVPFAVTNPTSITPTVASGINDAGQVIGNTQYAPNFIFDSATGTFQSINYTIGAGQVGLTLTTINNAGLTAGTGAAGPSFAAYGVGGIVNPATGSLTLLNDPAAPTPGSLTVTGIDNLGQVIGYTNPGIPPPDLIGHNNFVVIPQGFVFDPATGLFTNLPAPTGTTGFYAESLNDVGQAVGYASDGQGYVLDLATGTFTSLNDPDPQDYGTHLTGINDAGDIVGWYQKGSGIAGFIAIPQVSSVPEPASIGLLGIGILGLASARHWRTKAA